MNKVNSIINDLHINEGKDRKSALDEIVALCRQYKIYPEDVKKALDESDSGVLGSNIKVNLSGGLNGNLPFALSNEFDNDLVKELKTTNKNNKNILSVVKKHLLYKRTHTVKEYESTNRKIVFEITDDLKNREYLSIIY